MPFTDDQNKALSAPLDPKHVKPPAPGRFGDYIEGWHAIAEANRIFGFDGWNRTTEITQLGDPVQKADKWYVNYRARCTITVVDPTSAMPIVERQGCGFGQGIDRDVGKAHESALKEAETDAMKRALMTLGNPFGLALYDKTKANVGDPAAEGRMQEFEEAVIAAPDSAALEDLLTEYGADLSALMTRDKGEWQRMSQLFARRKRETIAAATETTDA